MSDRTAHGPLASPPPPAKDSARATARSRRSGFAAKADTKTTKVTKITKPKWSFVVFVAFVIFVTAREPSAVSPAAPQAGAQPETQAQQRPVFRGGTHFVRVDAYPAENGKIVEGLKPEDFEILEDGARQTVESFDFVRFDTFTPEAERREPATQQEGFDMAADPRNRVFVIVVDLPAASPEGPARTDIVHIQQPLVNFLDRVLGPQDLFGFLTSRNSAKDLVLARRTPAVTSQILDMFRITNMERDEADDALDPCMNGAMALKGLYRSDQLYTSLETLVKQLGAIREERKSVILVANGLSRARASLKLLELNGPRIPKIGITNGRIGIGDSNHPGAANERACTGEVQRLAAIDFDQRYRRLLEDARHENVSFYAITPAGLQVSSAAERANADLQSLADETDGVAIVNTNDLNGGMKRIADDLAAYYVLGYYTTNTKFDGGIRRLTVKLKGRAIRARREYRAPTEAEIAAIASGPRPAAAPVESGPPAVIGPPIAYRVSRAQPVEKVSLLEFVRADRLRVEWPVLAPLDRREARVLDSAGKPLPIDLPVSEAPERQTVVVELPLAPFSRGVYTIELAAGAGGKTEQRRLTFMMK